MSRVPPQRKDSKGRSVPTRNPVFAQTALSDIRRMRTGLKDEEAKVSYWRRIIQARIDLVSRNATTSVGDLAEVLCDARASHRRIGALSVDTLERLPALPDLVSLWNRVPGDSEPEREALLAELRAAEKKLSTFRTELHERIDLVTAELIARYREEPTLALTALNERLGTH